MLLGQVQVYKREKESCRIGLLTHSLALFLITVPHVLVSAVLTAVIIIPWVGLNPTGASRPLLPGCSDLLAVLGCHSQGWGWWELQ